MLYMKRRVVFILIVCCLIMQLDKSIKNSIAVAMPGEAVNTPVEEMCNTKDIEVKKDLAAYKEVEYDKEVTQNDGSDYEKIIAEADQAIADAEELINRIDGMRLEESKEVSEHARENIIISDRGGYKSYERVPQYNLSDEEFNLMARLVEAEAGGEPFEGQIAVANVVFNRVKAGWAGTVKEVITQNGQFTKARKEPSDSVKEAVKEAIYGRNTVPEGTLYFQNLDISTDFTIPNSKKFVTKIGMHSFYR